jgi:hypothetical protein
MMVMFRPQGRLMSVLARNFRMNRRASQAEKGFALRLSIAGAQA